MEVAHNSSIDQSIAINALPGTWSMEHCDGLDSYCLKYNFNPDGTGRESIFLDNRYNKPADEENSFYWDISDGFLQIIYDTNPGTPVTIELRIVGDTCMFSLPDMEDKPMVLFKEYSSS